MRVTAPEGLNVGRTCTSIVYRIDKLSGFAVNKPIEADTLLLVNALRDGLLQEAFVLLKRFLSVFDGRTTFSDFGSQWQRADCYYPDVCKISTVFEYCRDSDLKI